MGNLAHIFGGNGFDASTVPESDFGLLPKSKQPMMITEAEVKQTKAGDGQYVKLVHEIIDGQYKGRKIFVNLNIVNKNPDTERIAHQRLAQLTKAIGFVGVLDDTKDLVNKPFIGDVIISKSGDQNDVAGYSAFGGAASAPRFATASAASRNAGGFTPPKSQPASEPATATSTIATSPSSATPPWKR